MNPCRRRGAGYQGSSWVKPRSGMCRTANGTHAIPSVLLLVHSLRYVIRHLPSDVRHLRSIRARSCTEGCGIQPHNALGETPTSSVASRQVHALNTSPLPAHALDATRQRPSAAPEQHTSAASTRWLPWSVGCGRQGSSAFCNCLRWGQGATQAAWGGRLRVGGWLRLWAGGAARRCVTWECRAWVCFGTVNTTLSFSHDGGFDGVCRCWVLRCPSLRGRRG